MTPTIDQIEAALPYVPAGLHCGDLTEPDERREFAEVIHGIVVQATETAPESRLSDEQGSSAQSPQNDPQTPHTRNNGVSSWGPPRGEPAPNAVCPTCPILAEALPVDDALERIKPTPTDMTIAWGISEALIEEAE